MFVYKEFELVNEFTKENAKVEETSELERMGLISKFMTLIPLVVIVGV